LNLNIINKRGIGYYKLGTILVAMSAFPFNWCAGVTLLQHPREKNGFSAVEIKL